MAQQNSIKYTADLPHMFHTEHTEPASLELAVRQRELLRSSTNRCSVNTFGRNAANGEDLIAAADSRDGADRLFVR
jgi:hypothetical protein